MDTKELLCKVGLKMSQTKLVVACDGNISYRQADGTIIITPSGVPKGELKENMLVNINLEGKVLNGNQVPSSEMNMHMSIYKTRPDVQAIVHAHPIVATALTVANLSFPNDIVTEGRDFLGPVTTVSYGTPASLQLAEKCAAAISSVNAILMDNHGAVAVGKSLSEALYRMETLEAVATIYRDALLMKSAVGAALELNRLKE